MDRVKTIDEAELATDEAIRLEGALRGLIRRVRHQIPSWLQLLDDLNSGSSETDQKAPNPLFVDWLETIVHNKRMVDIAIKRHFIDPSRPLAELVLKPAHGVLIASATLTDGHEAALDDQDGFELAKRRSGRRIY